MSHTIIKIKKGWIMKKLLSVFLMLTTICAASCSNKISNAPETSEPLTNISSHSKSVFQNYDDILKRYQDLLSNECNEKNVQTDQLYSDQNDCTIEEALQSTVINSDTGIMGYAIYDVNHDDCAELFLMDEHYHIYAVFSQRNENPILLDRFGVNNHYVSLDQNGIFYQTGYGKGENSYTKIMRIAVSGDFEVLLEYGCSDDGMDYKYYVIENNVKRMIDLQEITILQEQYNSFLQNPSEATKFSGLQFFPIMNTE